MAFLHRVLACSSLLLSANDAFRARAKLAKKGTPDKTGGHPIAARRYNETKLEFYNNRPRVRSAECPKPSGKPANVGEVKDVDWVYTFAAPGPTSPGLKHGTNEDGIFPGVRAWQVTADGWVDIVPIISGLADMWHPWMDAEEVATDQEPVYHHARENVTHWPYTIWGTAELHGEQSYVPIMDGRDECPEWKAYSQWPLVLSHFTNDEVGKAANFASERGWNLVGYGLYDGSNGLLGGAQASFLIQNRETLECVVTFQGSKYLKDWIANAAFSPTHFCGYTEKDERCIIHGGFCQPRKERGTFAHWGFAVNLRNMVREESWQQGVRAKLGKCSAVYVTGHSLGGAAASLFTACISQKLQDGDYGFEEDYKYMAWTQAQPELMEAIEV